MAARPGAPLERAAEAAATARALLSLALLGEAAAFLRAAILEVMASYFRRRAAMPTGSGEVG